jgi:hypothetical protein
MSTFSPEQRNDLVTAFREAIRTEGLADQDEVRKLRAELDAEKRIRHHFEQLAAERGEEVAGRGEDLRALELGTHALVRTLWPGKEGEELLESDIAGETAQLFARMTERVRGLMELSFKASGEAPPVDHARETLAQLEVMLWDPTLPGTLGRTGTLISADVIGEPELVMAERWGGIVGRLLLVLEVFRQTAGHLEYVQTEARPGLVPVRAFEALLEHWEAASNVGFIGAVRREVLNICASEVVQVLVDHKGLHPRDSRAKLLRRMKSPAQSTPADVQVGPGETPECGAVHELQYGARGLPAFTCTRPAGHEGQHESHSSLLHTWEG